MSAETVTNKIEEKARAAAEAIIAEAKAKAEEERKAILDDASARASKMLDAAKQNAEIAERGRAQADSLNKKLGILEVKREALAKAKADAKAKLSTMDQATFTKIFTKYLAASELSGSFVLLPSAAHRDLCEKAVADLEKSASIKLTISDKNAETDTGFILSSENFDVEFSLDAILDSVFEKDESIIADILFETGDVK